jgi:hypothetical protein
MIQMELPATATIKAFGGIRKMAKKIGRPSSTVFSRIKAGNRFPHWWTTDLMAIAAREGIPLPEAKPRKKRPASKAKRRAA